MGEEQESIFCRSGSRSIPHHSSLIPHHCEALMWHPVAPADSIPPGEYTETELDGAIVAVFNVAGSFYAVEDQCTHDGGGLAGGAVEGDQVICPRHGARFCLRTGQAL